MVGHPAEYLWSSYRANALGQHDPIVTPHARCIGPWAMMMDKGNHTIEACLMGR